MAAWWITEAIPVAATALVPANSLYSLRNRSVTASNP